MPSRAPAARAGLTRQSQYSESLIGQLQATEELPPRRLTESKQNGREAISSNTISPWRVGQWCESIEMEMVIPGLSCGGLLACFLHGGRCAWLSCSTRVQVGLRYKVWRNAVTLFAGWLASFALSKTNNGHVTGRVLCLLACLLAPEKGGGSRPV